MIVAAGCAPRAATSVGSPGGLPREATGAVRGASAGNYIAIDAGGWHTCALSTDRQLYCWGWNRHGQLGTGDDTDRAVPTPVAGLPGEVVAVAAGMAHTCAVLVDGSVHCWGWNAYGQVDGQAAADALRPQRISAAEPAKGVAAGWTHSCALGRAAVVSCWGRSQVARTGRVRAGVYAPAPVEGVPRGVTELVAGAAHSCARVPYQGLSCWGDNQHWQLGSELRDWDALPVPDARLGAQLAHLAAGFYHTCAVSGAEARAVHCWGGNRFGQLGRKACARAIPPGPVEGLDASIAWLAAGEGHSCALVAGGKAVLCWGDNRHGQLGTGDGISSERPRRVAGLAGRAIAISAGRGHSCALGESGAIQCWGANRWGQLGDGGTQAATRPRGIAAPTRRTRAPGPRWAGCGACKRACPPCPEPPPCPEDQPAPCPPCPPPCPSVECPPCPAQPSCPPVIACTCPQRACPGPREPDCPPCTQARKHPCPPPRACEACPGPRPCPPAGSPCPPCPEGYAPEPHPRGGPLPGPVLPAPGG